jgi:predicted membrane GTPase involved in stress response
MVPFTYAKTIVEWVDVQGRDKKQRREKTEEVTIDVDDEFTGAVIEKLTGPRRGELVEMKPAGVGKTRIIAYVPSRGLIGYHGQFMTDTRGLERTLVVPKVSSMVISEFGLPPLV